MTAGRAAAVLAALSALVAGCGGGPPGEPVATTEVTMAKSYRFAPERIVVEAGATVTWRNEDNFTHTVQLDGEDDHHVGRDESLSLTFERPGDVPLRLHAAQAGHGRRRDRPVTAVGVVGRDVVVVSCAISAGVHVALAPEHFAESRAAGARFLASAILLAAAATALTLRPSATALTGACVLLSALLASFGLAVTSGVPLVHLEPESADVLGLADQAD